MKILFAPLLVSTGLLWSCQAKEAEAPAAPTAFSASFQEKLLDAKPGDVIEITERFNLPCDITLLSGSCVVNEAMLTGESIPVVKNQIPFNSDVYDIDKDSKYSLFGGTTVI